LKQFKSKKKIDLAYSEKNEEKLKIPAQPIIHKQRDSKSFKEKLINIKQKPNQLPPIESRLDSNLAHQSKTLQPGLFEKEPSSLSLKEKSLLHFTKEEEEEAPRKPYLNEQSQFTITSVTNQPKETKDVISKQKLTSKSS
jgi:hypothetical protein